MIESPAVGFTGSRYGLSVAQALALRKLLAEGPWKVLPHGDCVGRGRVLEEEEISV